MKDKLKYVLKLLLRLVLKVFWLFPIKKYTIFFMANMGKNFLCNPKYLYMSMINDDRYSNYTFIWCFKNTKNVDKSAFTQETKLVDKRNVFLYFYRLLTSEAIIYNCGGFSYAPIRKKQLLIETWHGGGAFKRVGLSIPGKSKASKKGITLASRDIKLFLSTSQISSELVIKQSLDYHGEILNSGFPRNDILFHSNDGLVYNIKEKMGIQADTHIVLYAPTFKGSEDKAVNTYSEVEMINAQLIKKSLHDRFGGEWVFWSRGHQYTKDIDIPGSDLDITSYPDMQELLIISDVLISDYSSSIWDYAITKKPCFLFVPDIEKYKNEERGFLTPIEKWPGVLCINNDDINKSIQQFDYQQYYDHIQSYFDTVKSYEEGNACQKTLNRILEIIK